MGYRVKVVVKIAQGTKKVRNESGRAPNPVTRGPTLSQGSRKEARRGRDKIQTVQTPKEKTDLVIQNLNFRSLSGPPSQYV